VRWGEATDKEQDAGWEQATGRMAPGDCSPRAPTEPDLWGAWVGDHPGLPGQFSAGGAGLWRPSPTEGVLPRKQLKVYFFLPRARPVTVKVGLEQNRSVVGKTANSLVYPRRQQLTPLPCGGPARLDPSP
jgi:hypothetical protein